MKDFFARLFGKKSAAGGVSASPDLPQTAPVAYTGPVTFVWHRNVHGEPTGSGVEFPPGGGPGTMMAGRDSAYGASVFCLGAILRRSMEPWAQLKAAKWAGARFTEDGEPLWDIESEQRFAEGYVEYTNETGEPDSPKDFVPMNLGRPPLTDEMRRLFANPYEEEESEIREQAS